MTFFVLEKRQQMASK